MQVDTRACHHTLIVVNVYAEGVAPENTFTHFGGRDDILADNELKTFKGVGMIGPDTYNLCMVSILLSTLDVKIDEIVPFPSIDVYSTIFIEADVLET